MYKFILGRKIGMSQIFRDNEVAPVTIIEAGPCTVVDIKDSEKNKYSSIQIGFDEKKKIKKPIYGQARKLGNFNVLREFRLPEDVNYFNVGAVIKVNTFNEGDIISIAGISKGKGFQGVIKRHGFKKWPRTHGHPHQRQPGSIGSMTPQRVVKGRRMAGRMGAERITTRNLKIIGVDNENNLLIVKGAVPGRKGTILEVREATLTKLGKVRKLPRKLIKK